MKLKRTTLLLALCGIAVTLSAQDDFGLDLGLEGSTKLAKGLKLGIDLGMRTQDNTQRVDRYSIASTLSYKIFTTADKKVDLKISGGFSYMWVHKLQESTLSKYSDTEYSAEKLYDSIDRYWQGRHRTTLALTLGYTPSKRWSFTLKESVQYNHYCSKDSVGRKKWRINDDDEPYIRPGETKNIGAKDRFVLRNKAEATYDIPGCKIDPYISVDYGVGLNYTANKWKFTLGGDYKITKGSKFGIFYRYNTESDDDEVNGHLLGLSYKIEF